MMISFTDLRLLENYLLATALGVPRVLVVFWWVQIFGSSIFPKTLRLGIAIGFSIPIMASVAPSLGHVATEVPIVVLILKELFLGLLLGYALCAPFWAIESVGALFDQQRGANAAQMVTPFATPDLSFIGSLLRFALIAFLIATGGLTPLYELLLMSFDAWPVLSLVPDFGGFGPHEMFDRFSEVARLSLLYAAPILVVLGLIDLGFAIINVFAQQLPTYFAAMPVKSLVGIFILALYINVLLQHGSEYFSYAIGFDAAKLRAVNVKK
jgi:type III secretion protein T